MKTIHFLSIAVVALSVSACATQKIPVSVGGSRADGTVELAYQYSWLESPVVDMQAANTEAARRCQAWGYQEADPFGGQKQNCVSRNGYGNCLEAQVTITYQCKGGGPH